MKLWVILKDLAKINKNKELQKSLEDIQLKIKSIAYDINISTIQKNQIIQQMYDNIISYMLLGKLPIWKDGKFINLSEVENILKIKFSEFYYGKVKC